MRPRHRAAGTAWPSRCDRGRPGSPAPDGSPGTPRGSGRHCRVRSSLGVYSPRTRGAPARGAARQTLPPGGRRALGQDGVVVILRAPRTRAIRPPGRGPRSPRSHRASRPRRSPAAPRSRPAPGWHAGLGTPHLLPQAVYRGQRFTARAIGDAGRMSSPSALRRPEADHGAGGQQLPRAGSGRAACARRRRAFARSRPPRDPRRWQGSALSAPRSGRRGSSQYRLRSSASG
jgi:hypothetical protein